MSHSHLHELAVNNHCGKRSHDYNGQSYLDVYDKYLFSTRETVRHVLELGVYRGESLKMWRDYFKNATIWGVDIDPEAAKHPYGERIKVITGSQADPETLSQVAPGEILDLVIDDGSHLVDHIIESYRLLWPRVKAGGHYFIEDLDCTYADMTPFVEEWPGQKHNGAETNFKNDRSVFDKWVMERVLNVDHGDQLRFITFQRLQCILGKL